MARAEFDAFVDAYEQQHRDSIRLTGEDSEFFADYKIKELRRLSDRWGMSAPRILDFGSGIGNSIPAFRYYFAQTPVVAADVSADSLAAARQLHGGNEPQLLIEGNRIPAEAASFDVVFTACVFHHIPESEHVAWLQELRRVTRPGGRIVVFEHNPLNPLTLNAVNRCPFDVNAVLIRAGAFRKRLSLAGWSTPRTNYHLFFPRALSKLRPLERGLRWCAIGGQYSCHATAMP